MIAQIPLFTPTSDWKPTPVSEMPSWEGAKRVCIDTETFDPNLRSLGPGVRRDGKIIGISFAIEDGPQHYLPVRHPEDNLNPDQVFAYLADQAKSFKGDLVGMNLSYDLDYLAEEGVEFKQVKFFRDVGIADALIDELQDSYSLESIAARHGMKGKDLAEVTEAARVYVDSGRKPKDPRLSMHLIPGRFVAAYAIGDVKLPLLISRRQEKIIDDQDLWNIYNLESRVIPVLLKMRRRGIKIDQNKLDEVEMWALREEKEALRAVKEFTNVEIPVGGVWKANLVVKALSAIGISTSMTSKGQPNIDKDFLEGVDHEVAKSLSWARKVNKLRTTFVASVRQHMTNGRIHCVFNQLARDDDAGGGVRGVRYGRLSCEHPNMQQQPSRDEFASMWRSIYVPNDGGKWGTLDYSQQEPRMLTHYAVLAKCCMAEKAANRYREDPNTDNHQMMADLTGLPRKYAKSIYLGLCYGMGGAKLSREVDLPTKRIFSQKAGRWIEVAGDEAQEVLDKFNEHAPFVKELAQMTERAARERGWIRTVCGRKCRFPKDAVGNFDWCHKALSRLIQGSTADQTKLAMVEVDAAGYELQLQVHDELDLTVKDKKQAKKIASIMMECLPLQVPSKVDVEIGPSWGEAK